MLLLVLKQKSNKINNEVLVVIINLPKRSSHLHPSVYNVVYCKHFLPLLHYQVSTTITNHAILAVIFHVICSTIFKLKCFDFMYRPERLLVNRLLCDTEPTEVSDTWIVVCFDMECSADMECSTVYDVIYFNRYQLH